MSDQTMHVSSSEWAAIIALLIKPFSVLAVLMAAIGVDWGFTFEVVDHFAKLIGPLGQLAGVALLLAKAAPWIRRQYRKNFKKEALNEKPKE